jgi:hypothetical protein
MSYNLKFNPYKKCPICHQLLRKFRYRDGEWIYQCVQDNYLIRVDLSFLELRVHEFWKRVYIGTANRSYIKEKNANLHYRCHDDIKTAFLKFGKKIKAINRINYLKKKHKNASII